MAHYGALGLIVRKAATRFESEPDEVNLVLHVDHGFIALVHKHTE